MAPTRYLPAGAREELMHYFALQEDTLKRLGALLKGAEGIRGLGSARVLVSALDEEEILRAAVVLMHACLEDFVRTVARNLLQHAGAKSLDKIPIKLGTLKRRKGEPVDRIIGEEVSNHLDRITFNSKEDIKNLFNMLALELQPRQESYLKMLDEMQQRRHKIVHRGDKTEWSSAKITLRPIAHAEIAKWLTATKAFMESVWFELLKAHVERVLAPRH
jgi:hypothetical protein